MKPPIPSPWPEPGLSGPVTKRLEWNETEQCFVLYYRSPGTKRLLRGEWLGALNNPMGWFIGVTGVMIGLPIIVLIVWIAHLRSKNRVHRFSIFPWGIRDVGLPVSGEMSWSEVKRIASGNGDIYVIQKSIWKGNCRLIPEYFANQEESRRCEELLRWLWQSNGEEWSRLTAQYTQSKEVGDVYTN